MSVSSLPDALAGVAFLIYFPVSVKAYGDYWGQASRAERKGCKGSTD